MNRLPRLVRFAMSAGFNWGVDFAAFILLLPYLGIPLGLLASRLIGGAVSFVTHKFFSFQSKTEPTQREVVGFILLWLTNYAIVTALVMALPGGTDLIVLAAKFSVEILVFAANYLFLKRLFIEKRRHILAVQRAEK